ncbi:hypothetical protein HYX01_02800 [Candidatus Woesearchaeota archaeon]|nr:hypothetical protein [Candidatus Woesearchaeota archaeon]
MTKKLQIVCLIALLLLVVSCAPKSKSAATAKESGAKTIAATGEMPVDKVATDISDASNTDKELDTAELNNVDAILSDIEKI